jgi:hypothetical protein
MGRDLRFAYSSPEELKNHLLIEIANQEPRSERIRRLEKLRLVEDPLTIELLMQMSKG